MTGPTSTHCSKPMCTRQPIIQVHWINMTTGPRPPLEGPLPTADDGQLLRTGSLPIWFFFNWFYGPNTGPASRCKYCTVGSFFFFFLWLIVFLVDSTSPYKDKNEYGPFCRAFVDIWLAMALTTATVYGWKISIAVRGRHCQGGGFVLGSVATMQQHMTHGCTLSKTRGGLLGQVCLSGEEHPSWDRVAVVHWMTRSSWDRPSGTPSCQQLEECFPFIFLFLF